MAPIVAEGAMMALRNGIAMPRLAQEPKAKVVSLLSFISASVFAKV